MNSYKYQLQEDYLIHFGVPGMKWGVRKSEQYKSNRSSAKAAYKSAKKDLRTAKRMKNGYIGIKGLNKYRDKKQAIEKASMNVLNKKAAYNASKKTTTESANKAEFKTYRKSMQRSGIRDSAADMNSGGRSTKIYNNIKTQKGKEYADKVEKSVQNRAYATLAGSAAVLAGSAALQVYLNKRR